jgi:hypothetical protein
MRGKLPRISRAKANAGTPQPLDITHQQRLEQMEQLADIFACIFASLTPEQRASYMSESVYQEAA